MAAPGGQYFIQSQLRDTFPHHESFEQLWETKWKKPCSMGVYPFMFGAIQDFEPVVEALVQQGQREPYDWDAYAAPFFPQAEKLFARAEDAGAAGRREEACELYLRSSAVYRIARFPAPRSPKQREAWILGKVACLKGLSLLPRPIHEVHIPHTAGLPSEGHSIPAYHNLPSSPYPVPLVIILTGLDGYRTELAVWTAGFASQSIATLILEIPGTGDCPATPSDPTSPDRLYTSVLSWVHTQPGIDPSRVLAWGFSTGGYYAMRIAHTHHAHLAGAICFGGGCHHMFDPEWLDASLRQEYPFDLGTTLAWKFGYRTPEPSNTSSSSSTATTPTQDESAGTFTAFKTQARSRFSLLEDGTLANSPCTRLLLVNGTEDSIFPVDDMWVAASHGNRPKELRLVPGKRHMGEPESFRVCLEWIYDVLGVKGDWRAHVATLPFRAKFP